MRTVADSQGHNLIGAIIFVCYVSAALFLTGFINGMLLHAYRSLPSTRPKYKVKNPHLAGQIRTFTSLSAISFSVLSYHMINVLLQSYKAWATTQNMESFDQLDEDQAFLNTQVFWPCICLWKWLKHSHLFEDFGNAIAENSARYWWTQQALLVSIAWSVFMSVEGKRRGIPHLWAYAVLAQILPISFAQNLFFLAILMTPIPNSKHTIYAPIHWLQILPLSAYFISLFYAPHAAGTQALIPVILITRFLLFSPLLIPLSIRSSRLCIPTTPQNAHSSRHISYRFIAVCSAGLWLWQTVKAISDPIPRKSTYRLRGSSLTEVLEAINDDPAVSALGWDFLISLISNVVWITTVQELPE